MKRELKEKSDEKIVTEKNSQKDLSPLVKKLYLITGFISLILGSIGIIVPILPTTPFLLLSAGCFARSSEKFYKWLINNKVLGAYIRNYREGTGMPLKIKIFTITLLWVTMLLTIFFLIEIQWVKYLLLIIAMAVTIHIALIRPKNDNEKN
ncbi:MAG: YbaN family protein [Promethearchaeia archaeon]